MVIQYQPSSIEFTIGGEKIDMSKAVVGIDFASKPPFDRAVVGKIEGGICYTATATMRRGDFDRLLAMLEPSTPKWGQPGRHRRRKMRLEARRKHEAIQLALSKLRKMHAGAVLIVPGTQIELVQAP